MRLKCSLLALSALASLFMTACNAGGSGRGESCRARNDCSDGLRCINNVCTQNDFDVSTTAQSCDLIECTGDADCCEEPPASCPRLQEDCRDFGDMFACDEFDRICVCRQGCEENRCVSRCNSDADCFGFSCVAGSCVECMTDDDCFGEQTCSGGSCVSGCTADADCPYFNTCMAGECVETGCTNDRECIAASDNPRAICVESACSAPCESDADCNPGGYRFQACEEGQCMYVGCETNEECRIFLSIPPGSETRAVCR